MRIDKWLYLNGYFESRSRAKLAVKMGLVLVDGRRVKPSYSVKGDERIEILGEDRPSGYYKLKKLDEEWRMFRGVEVVLDLGSSAGGFLLYASERAKVVFGIEYSREFERALRKIEEERGNVKVFIADAFTFDISSLPDLDLILCDLTLKPEDALKALNRFTPKLKRGGKVFFVSKEREVDVEGFEILNVVKADDKREWYYLMRKV